MSGQRHSEKSHGANGEITVGEIARRHQAFHDEQPMTVSCGFDGCRWSFEGPAAVARTASLDHRVAMHPDVADAAKLLARAQKAARATTKAANEKKYADQRAATKPEPLVSRPREVAAARSDEAVRRATAPSPATAKNVGGRPPTWSVERAVAAGVEHHAATGLLPTRGACDRSNGLPSYVVVRRLFAGMPGYQAAVEAAVPVVSPGSSEPEPVAISLRAPIAEFVASPLPPDARGLLRLIAREAQRTADAVAQFVEMYERDLLANLEEEAA